MGATSSAARRPSSTARTPGIVAAAAVSTARMRACGCGLRRIAACSKPGGAMSSRNSALPVSIRSPSRRSGCPSADSRTSGAAAGPPGTGSGSGEVRRECGAAVVILPPASVPTVWAVGGSLVRAVVAVNGPVARRDVYGRCWSGGGDPALEQRAEPFGDLGGGEVATGPEPLVGPVAHAEHGHGGQLGIELGEVAALDAVAENLDEQLAV